MREKLALGDVRAPVNGVVLERRRHVGEFCHFAQPALVLLEDSSLEIAVFLRQRSAGRFGVGSQARVVVEPDARPLTCKVVRVGDQYTDAPPAISTRFRSNENLLPIFLQPLDRQKNRLRARLGAIVKVLPQ